MENTDTPIIIDPINGGRVKKFLVTFKDVFEARSEEECYTILIKYLQDCVTFQDVVAFDFEELTEPQPPQ